MKKIIASAVILGATISGCSFADGNYMWQNNPAAKTAPQTTAPEATATRATLLSNTAQTTDKNATFQMMGQNSYLSLGIFFATLGNNIMNNNLFMPMLSVNVGMIEAGIGYSYTQNKAYNSGATENNNTFLGYAGVHVISFANNSLDISVGATGSTTRITNQSTHPYTVGPYVGVDYQLSEHFMITGHINPLTWSKNILKDTQTSVFSDGMIGMSYIF